MNRFIQTLLTLPLLAVLACGTVVDRTKAALVRVSHIGVQMTHFGPVSGVTICSGWSVADGLILTANHCIGEAAEQMLVDGVSASVIKRDEYYDLALLKSNLHKRVLYFRDTPVAYGDRVTGIGYGFGWTQPLVLTHPVLLANQSIGARQAAGIITNGEWVTGMSGGPVVDYAGRVVSMIQQFYMGQGYGVGTTMMKAFLLDAGVIGL